MGARSHLGQTTLGVFEHGLDLLASHAGKPREKINHASPIFDVCEQGFHGYARALEHPGAADFPGQPLNTRTLTPIKHEPSIRPGTPDGKPYIVAWPAEQKEIKIQRQTAAPTNQDLQAAGHRASEVTRLRKT